MLAIGENDARERNAILVLHRVADHGESVNTRFAVRCDIIGIIQIASVDFVARHEAVDVDRVRAFDLNGFQLVFFDLDERSFLHLIAARLLIFADDVAGLGINHLLLQPVAGVAINHVKLRLLHAGRRRIQHHRAGDERQLQAAFPVGAGRCHAYLRTDRHLGAHRNRNFNRR